MCVAHNYQHLGRRGYGSKTSRATLVELRSLGVGWVSLTPFGYMRSLADPQVHHIGSYRAGETDERMAREVRAAKDLGLRVLLKPHLWVVKGQWRGRIEMESDEDWSRWFDSYESWMLGYADMAQAEKVEALAIGVELKSTERRLRKRWRSLVAKIRARYDGALTYSANWDDVASVDWWDALDYIGVQFYPPLAREKGATEGSIRERLESALDELEALSEKEKRPVLFTEVGFRSTPGSLIRPHEWPERAREAEVDVATQATGYRLFIQAVRDRPWVRGIYWWKWFTDPATAEEGPAGFSPRGKPAEAILRAAYGGNCGAARKGTD